MESVTSDFAVAKIRPKVYVIVRHVTRSVFYLQVLIECQFLYFIKNLGVARSITPSCNTQAHGVSGASASANNA